MSHCVVFFRIRSHPLSDALSCLGMRRSSQGQNERWPDPTGLSRRPLAAILSVQQDMCHLFAIGIPWTVPSPFFVRLSNIVLHMARHPLRPTARPGRDGARLRIRVSDQAQSATELRRRCRCAHQWEGRGCRGRRSHPEGSMPASVDKSSGSQASFPAQEVDHVVSMGPGPPADESHSGVTPRVHDLGGLFMDLKKHLPRGPAVGSRSWQMLVFCGEPPWQRAGCSALMSRARMDREPVIARA
jgi:hypothetical protein